MYYLYFKYFVSILYLFSIQLTPFSFILDLLTPHFDEPLEPIGLNFLSLAEPRLLKIWWSTPLRYTSLFAHVVTWQTADQKESVYMSTCVSPAYILIKVGLDPALSPFPLQSPTEILCQPFFVTVTTRQSRLRDLTFIYIYCWWNMNRSTALFITDNMVIMSNRDFLIGDLFTRKFVIYLTYTLDYFICDLFWSNQSYDWTCTHKADWSLRNNTQLNSRRWCQENR